MAIGFFTIIAGLAALAGAYLYFFGVSAETKRKLENQALKTMGENKMSYLAKGILPKTSILPRDSPLTLRRSNQQSSYFRSEGYQSAQTGHQQLGGRCCAESIWGTSW